MNDQTTLAPVIRHASEGTQCWFFGGGVWTWKVSEQDGLGFSVVEVQMDGGKCTPLHTHPIAESLWVLDGQLRYRIEDDDVELGAGDFAVVPAGIPHAFMVTSETARVVAFQPGHDVEPFYLGASEPLDGSTREMNWPKLEASAAANGGITILGPPPF